MTDPQSIGAVPIVLAVGGTDSSGGAGLAADLVTLAAHAVHGAIAVTAVTAQGPRGVLHRTDLPGEAVTAQLSAAADLGVSVVKSGMLASAEAATALAAHLAEAGGLPYVCDPVSAATSGEALLDGAACEVLRDRLLPLALICTPNLTEAALLTRSSPSEGADALADKVLTLGPQWVLVTGGDENGDPTDVLAGKAGTRVRLRGERVATNYDRGTGCTLASAIAARLARGDALVAAVQASKAFVEAGLRTGFAISDGYGVPRRW